MMSKCCYCGNYKDLCKAHIIPKRFYPDPNKEKLRVVDSEDLSWKQRQNGIWDESILCSACDNQLNEYDKEGYRILRDDLKSKKGKVNDLNTVYSFKAGEFDFKKLRFFFISLIWRASISSEPTFKAVELGKYEAIALNILKGAIPDQKDLFEVMVVREPENAPFGNVVYVVRHNYGNKKAYKFTFNKFLVFIIPTTKNAVFVDNFDTNIFSKVFLRPENFVIVEHEMFMEGKSRFLSSVSNRLRNKK
ncbi:MAG TPA: hypothetical protein PLY88_05975 [Candidatus Omnitrophota bacterium]|nr:hypothetical protein [Candidatus Omnitrophota bacterium]